MHQTSVKWGGDKWPKVPAAGSPILTQRWDTKPAIRFCISIHTRKNGVVYYTNTVWGQLYGSRGDSHWYTLTSWILQHINLARRLITPNGTGFALTYNAAILTGVTSLKTNLDAEQCFALITYRQPPLHPAKKTIPWIPFHRQRLSHQLTQLVPVICMTPQAITVAPEFDKRWGFTSPIHHRAFAVLNIVGKPAHIRLWLQNWFCNWKSGFYQNQ